MIGQLGMAVELQQRREHTEYLPSPGLLSQTNHAPAFPYLAGHFTNELNANYVSEGVDGTHVGRSKGRGPIQLELDETRVLLQERGDILSTLESSEIQRHAQVVSPEAFL